MDLNLFIWLIKLDEYLFIWEKLEKSTVVKIYPEKFCHSATKSAAWKYPS